MSILPYSIRRLSQACRSSLRKVRPTPEVLTSRAQEVMGQSYDTAVFRVAYKYKGRTRPSIKSSLRYHPNQFSDNHYNSFCLTLPRIISESLYLTAEMKFITIEEIEENL